MTYEEALAYLENYTWSKTRLGLGRTRDLCAKLGDPQKKLKFIHVAGSNGKGSTCAMLASVLQAAGYKTGLYTSPYIQDFCERIQINGENIPHERLAAVTEQLREAAETMEDHPSWFEMVTAVAFKYYLEESCDIVVLEVGMGGEFDSTNVIDAPEVAVLTNIGLEHTEYLGDTIEAIATTKSGIIKPGCNVVSYDNVPEVKAIIAEIAERNDAPLVFADPEDIELTGRDLSGQVFNWKGRPYKIPLHGEHQLKNTSVVMEVLSAMRARGWEIPDGAVREGLAKVSWPARFQILAREPLFILDGGHNPQCAEAMTQCLADLMPGQKVDFLLGILADKDYSQMIDILSPYAASFHCIAPENERALGAPALADNIRARGFETYAYDDLAGAIGSVLTQAADAGRPAVCFGSLYLAGEILNTYIPIYKKWLRRHKIAVREALKAGDRAEKSSLLCARIADTQEFADAETVLIYNWTGGEVRLDDIRDIAEEQGKRVLYPVCVSKTEMIAVEPGEGDDAWRKGSFGILEPDPEKGTIVPPAEIDLVICPCTSFDEEGRRLGMGGGFYDRYLPECTGAYKISAAYEVQKTLQIPAEKFDIHTDAIVTEDAIYRVKK